MSSRRFVNCMLAGMGLLSIAYCVITAKSQRDAVRLEVTYHERPSDRGLWDPSKPAPLVHPFLASPKPR
ncbi:MAG TPA: hypothetical protein VMI31_07835 [Fimbriimonadaceae bacterium]|nr:hypothetical protein [Fimbriimonadaceae bacterium]